MASEELYDGGHIEFLEALWGDGWLSPGGPDEVDRLLEGVDLRGRRVLDIGCGTAGVSVHLATAHGAGEVVGIDVERTVCSRARRRVAAAGLGERIRIERVDPGPIPFGDGSFDVVFSKDSIVHIPDKEALARDTFRLLRPGGVLVVSDWLMSHDGPPSPEMRRYLDLEDLDFGMASPDRYRRALDEAGFAGVEVRNRNEWYHRTARAERDHIAAERPRFDATLGADEVAAQLRTWDAMITVLASGEHCPHHLRAHRP